jgi:hypothetical protein
MIYLLNKLILNILKGIKNEITIKYHINNFLFYIKYLQLFFYLVYLANFGIGLFQNGICPGTTN